MGRKRRRGSEERSGRGKRYLGVDYPEGLSMEEQQALQAFATARRREGLLVGCTLVVMGFATELLGWGLLGGEEASAVGEVSASPRGLDFKGSVALALVVGGVLIILHALVRLRVTPSKGAASTGKPRPHE